MVIETTYMGIHRYGKRSKKQREIIERKVPAIVTEETWHQAQQVLKDNQIEAMRSAKSQYLLRSLVKCGCCGLNYHGSFFYGAKGLYTAYYICNGKTVYRGPLQGKCLSKNIPTEWLEELVWQDCINFIMSPGKALAELNASMEESRAQKVNIETEKQMVMNTIIAKETEKQSILDLFRKKVINAKDVEIQLQKIGAERISLELRIQELDQHLNASNSIAEQFNTAEHFLSSLKEKIEDGNPPWEIKRKIVKALVRDILIETKKPEGGRPQAFVTVRYSFSPEVVHHTDKRAMNNFGNYIVHRKSFTKCETTQTPGNTLAKRFHWARMKVNMDIIDVSNQTGLSFDTLSKIENGHTQWLKTSTLRLLTKVLNQPAYFLGCFDLLPSETLGQRIKKARLYHCLNIEEFAVELEVNEKMVRLWEKDVCIPTKENLRKLESYMAILEM